jgi:hypothetical protein
MGPVVASYLVRVTLRKRDDLPDPPGAPGLFTSESEPPIPTNERVERLVGDALYDGLTYFTEETIHVASERTDE